MPMVDVNDWRCEMRRIHHSYAAAAVGLRPCFFSAGAGVGSNSGSGVAGGSASSTATGEAASMAKRTIRPEVRRNARCRPRRFAAASRRLRVVSRLSPSSRSTSAHSPGAKPASMASYALAVCWSWLNIVGIVCISSYVGFENGLQALGAGRPTPVFQGILAWLIACPAIEKRFDADVK